MGGEGNRLSAVDNKNKKFLPLILDFVATAVYGGQPDAPSGSVYDILFDEGVRMGSWGLLLHSVTGIYLYMSDQNSVTLCIKFWLVKLVGTTGMFSAWVEKMFRSPGKAGFPN